MKQRVAFIGAGSHSDAVKPHLDIYNYEFVGYFDDKDIKEYKGYPILGKTNDVLKCLHEKKIDKVFITIGDNKKRKELFDLVNEKYPDAFINIVSREATILTDSSIRGKGILMVYHQKITYFYFLILLIHFVLVLNILLSFFFSLFDSSRRYSYISSTFFYCFYYRSPCSYYCVWCYFY